MLLQGGLDTVHVSFVVFLNHVLISQFMCQRRGETFSVIQVTESDSLLSESVYVVQKHLTLCKALYLLTRPFSASLQFKWNTTDLKTRVTTSVTLLFLQFQTQI